MAYRQLALARQAGDPIEAGLTFVAEYDDDDGDGVDIDHANDHNHDQQGSHGEEWTGVSEELGSDGAKTDADAGVTGNFSLFLFFSPLFCQVVLCASCPNINENKALSPFFR